ncbi:MAG: hypothetical protein GQ476_06560, partial [Candidatus Aminicenantes bacterium]|nr:hypothetical protein [Candidatus Aminicenantes bacterium]
MKKIIFALIILLISSLLVFSQEETKETFGLNIDESIKVDGFLDEPVWEKAPEVGDFIQFEPERGKLASLKTTVKILYSKNFIYFG